MATILQTITIRLFAGLEARTAERRSSYEIPLAEAPTVGLLGARLGLQPGAVGLVLVNGLHAAGDHELVAGDEVSLFPPLGGG
ncbi:MAG: MoaD/ThiS family protein [Thermoleophilia bacterium]